LRRIDAGRSKAEFLLKPFVPPKCALRTRRALDGRGGWNRSLIENRSLQMMFLKATLSFAKSELFTSRYKPRTKTNASRHSHF
jgi:hypothetical protein